MHQSDDRPRLGTTGAEISDKVVRLTHAYTGRGPTKARTSIGRDVVTVVLRDTLTKAERTLADNGKADIVLQMRHEFQRAMREEMTVAVETILERKVIAFMSDNHIDPDMAVEIFVLESEAGPTNTPSADERA